MGKCDGMVHLRRARPSDARAIAEVHVRSWQQAYAELLPREFLAVLNVDHRERYWSEELAVLTPERRPWLADAAGEVVGFVHVGPSRDDDAPRSTGELYAIYVLPDCWDRGVGRSLLAHAQRDLLENGYDEATLWVLTDNERAQRFYEAAGWVADGATKVEPVGGVELIETRYRRGLVASRVS